jgi:hypothetical protein
VDRALVVNASPLILLARIDRLDLLVSLTKLLVVPEAVNEDPGTSCRRTTVPCTGASVHRTEAAVYRPGRSARRTRAAVCCTQTMVLLSGQRFGEHRQCSVARRERTFVRGQRLVVRIGRTVVHGQWHLVS